MLTFIIFIRRSCLDFKRAGFLLIKFDPIFTKKKKKNTIARWNIIAGDNTDIVLPVINILKTITLVLKVLLQDLKYFTSCES